MRNRTLRIFALAVLTIVSKLGFAQGDSTVLNKLQISGFFENQLLGQVQHSEYSMTNYNLLRLNLNAKVDDKVSFFGNINYRTFHGRTQQNVLNFLPRRVVSDYINELGQPYEEVENRFANPLNDGFLFDNAYVTIYANKVNVRIGKQQLPWGTGYIWNPTNVFQARNMLDPTYELVGVNAVKVEYLLSNQATLTGVMNVSDQFENSNYAIKLKNHINGFDVSLSHVYFQYSTTDFYTFTEFKEQKHQIGADFSGSIGGFGVYGEGAYRMDASKSNTTDANFLNALVGLNYYFANGLYMFGEYYFNQNGKSNYREYNINDWMNYLGPYAEGLGKQYMFYGANTPVGSYWNVSAFVLWNMSDGSYMLYPRVEYSIGNNTELISQLFLPNGKANTTEFGSGGIGGMVRVRVYF